MSRRDEPRITRIQPLRPRGLRVRIHLTGTGDPAPEPLEVALEALERTRMGVGDLLTARLRHRLLEEDARVRVRDAALNLLSYRARTRRELARRLRQKGFHHAHIEPCLDRLEEAGFLDDRAVAESFVRDRLRHKPRGRGRLGAELRAKGVDPAAATQAVARVFEDEAVDDVVLAKRAAEMWVRRQGARTLDALHASDRDIREKARRRLMGYLQRRGFSGDALRAGMACALAEAAKGDGS